MLPKTHIILGFIFSFIIFVVFPQITLFGALIIFISSVLIDVDHYLLYVYKKKDISLKNAFKFFIEKSRKYHNLSHEEREKIPTPPCILHGIEVIVLLSILAYFFNFFLFVLIGFLFHEFLDFISILNNKYNINHVFFQSVNIIKYKKSKNRYLDI